MEVICDKCQNKIIVRSKGRSLNQNSYYFGCVVELISETTGMTPSEVHDALKLKFLRVVKGKMETLRSTTELNTQEFEFYLDQVRLFATTELNCVIPLPQNGELVEFAN